MNKVELAAAMDMIFSRKAKKWQERRYGGYVEMVMSYGKMNYGWTSAR